MTNQHPITPPPELIQEWLTKGRHQNNCSPLDYAIAQTAQWTADQQLKVCCEWFKNNQVGGLVNALSAAEAAATLHEYCRPKPPSLKDQALAVLNGGFDYFDGAQKNTIRTALEALPDDN